MCLRSITAAVGARRAKATIKASAIAPLTAFRTHKAGGKKTIHLVAAFWGIYHYKQRFCWSTYADERNLNQKLVNKTKGVKSRRNNTL